MDLDREFPVNAPVGPRQPNREDDVTLVQGALSLVEPHHGAGSFYRGRVDGRYGPRTEEAVRAFQLARNDQQNGVVRPHASTHRMLAEAAERELRTRPAPPPARLTFDGERLCWVGRPFDGKCWDAVSGAQGYQEPRHQSIRNAGPIPEGRYSVRQDDHQNYHDRRIADRIFDEVADFLFGVRPFDDWRGGLRAWGEDRVWLHPLPGTETFGRYGFSIHGGETPGSIGCVDLTHQMPDFIATFDRYEADMELGVQY